MEFSNLTRLEALAAPYNMFQARSPLGNSMADKGNLMEDAGTLNMAELQLTGFLA